jgi:hypothetical protein
MKPLPPDHERLLLDSVVPLLLLPPPEDSDPLDLRVLADWFVRPELTRELVQLLAVRLDRATGFTVRLASATLFTRRVPPGGLYLAVLPTRTAKQLDIGPEDTVREPVPGLMLRILQTYGSIIGSPSPS